MAKLQPGTQGSWQAVLEKRSRVSFAMACPQLRLLQAVSAASPADTLDMPLVDFKSAQLLKLVQKAGLFWTKLNSTRCLKATQAILQVV